jgi:hypothetical protein
VLLYEGGDGKSLECGVRGDNGVRSLRAVRGSAMLGNSGVRTIGGARIAQLVKSKFMQTSESLRCYKHECRI